MIENDLEYWDDDRLSKRYKLLSLIDEGHTELTEGGLAEFSFPGGFDPEGRAADSLDAVAQEIESRLGALL